jgi:uncharacterized membrane protein
MNLPGVRSWEIHPALAHFPIALLLAAVVADLWTVFRRSETRSRAAAGLYVAGFLAALPTAAAGLLAWYTVPHAEAAHGLMIWHPLVALASVILFAVLVVVRWRARGTPPSRPQRALAIGAALLLGATGLLGGQLVFRRGVGVSTTMPPTREDDHHGPVRP